MFWWTVGPLGVFSCIVLAILGTIALIRVSPADPYPSAGDDVDL